MRFRIEYHSPSNERPAFVFARAIDASDFALGLNPTLGGVAIHRSVTQPRALLKDGSPDSALFCFHLRSRADIAALPVGTEVLLDPGEVPPLPPFTPPVGAILDGTVRSVHTFGFFVDLPHDHVGLVERPWVSDTYPVAEADLPARGAAVSCAVLAVTVEPEGVRIHLSTRASDLANAKRGSAS